MKILVDELQPNQMGAFYLMSLGVDMPDAVTKTDLTSIITFLCKKLCWVEEEDKTDTKSSGKTNHNNLPNDISADNGEIEKEIPEMDWIEDTLSDPIRENLEEGSLVDTLPQASATVTGVSENGNHHESTSNDKIFTMKNEIDSICMYKFTTYFIIYKKFLLQLIVEIVKWGII